MWEVLRYNQGDFYRLPALPPFESRDQAEEFAERFAKSNVLAPPILLKVRAIV